MAAGDSGKSLEETPTWAVALVCTVFVVLSILIEHAIHFLGKRHKKAMLEALEKIKAELILLGFISLLLTVGPRAISKICVRAKYGDTILPCEQEHDNKGGDHGDSDDRRRLLSYSENLIWRRVLAAGDQEDHCSDLGKVALISAKGLHQLHIFIFLLAVFHVLYSAIIMALGRAKMKKWKAWVSETSSIEYQFTNDPARFRFTRQTSFVKRHRGFSRMPGVRWIVAFFRQFSGSVSKVEYWTMRHGFINVCRFIFYFVLRGKKVGSI